MSNIDDEVIVLVKRLAKTIKKVGVKKVVAALDELNTEEGFIEAHRNLIDYIIKESCNIFRVAPQDLKKKNIRGVAVECRSMCFVLIKKHLNYRHQDIVGIFGSNSHSLVSNSLSEFDNLNYDYKQDRIIIDRFKILNEKVEERKKMLWTKYS